MKIDERILKLYAITDRSWLRQGRSLAQEVEEAILGGATIIQLREKYLEGEDLKNLALSVQAVCSKYQVPFIVNDDVALAEEIGADGVHVGQSDMAVAQAREILGESAIIGATAKTIEQALEAERAGADYLGSGAVFGSSTKTDAVKMSPALLTEICQCVSIPVVAIGGINASNLAQLRGIPMAGPAVVSGIFAEEDCRKAAASLRAIREGLPVVHCITNHVTVNDVANMLLAYGGSPIMSHHPMEVEEVQTHGDGLLINLGAIEDFEAMKIAYETALREKHPIVIDPVGVGGNSYRRERLKELLSLGSPTCIRGNQAEIRAIYLDRTTSKGLDDDMDRNQEESLGELARKLAEECKCIVCASGETDYISDGRETVEVHSGSPMQRRITGSGCMLSACICKALCGRGKPSLYYVAEACRLLEDAAVRAAQEDERQGMGTMTFRNLWIDYVSRQ